MKTKTAVIFFVSLLLFSLFFHRAEGNGHFYRFSMDRMEEFFLSPEAREIFGVEEEEAVAVFGDEGENVFL
ncbi:MAG: hypothetical protein IKT50_04000 [Clostridia bacterium]|nr:hypothetical protein [Clostridia bacterium]